MRISKHMRNTCFSRQRISCWQFCNIRKLSKNELDFIRGSGDGGCNGGGGECVCQRNELKVDLCAPVSSHVVRCDNLWVQTVSIYTGFFVVVFSLFFCSITSARRFVSRLQSISNKTCIFRSTWLRVRPGRRNGVCEDKIQLVRVTPIIHA